MIKAKFDPDRILGDNITQFSRQGLCDFIAALCEAVKADAGAGVFRGGIYPDNISIDENGGIAVGPAKQEDWVGQELTFLSPELYWNGKRTPASDVYSIGLMMYYAVTGGKLPFEGSCRDPLLRRMGGEEFEIPKAAGRRLGEIIGKSTRFKADERYQSMDEMRVMAESCLKNLYLNGAPSAETIFRKNDDDLTEIEKLMVDIIEKEEDTPIPVPVEEENGIFEELTSDAAPVGVEGEVPIFKELERRAEEDPESHIPEFVLNGEEQPSPVQMSREVEEELPPVLMSPEAEEELPPVQMNREAEEELPPVQMSPEVKKERPSLKMRRKLQKELPSVQMSSEAEEELPPVQMSPEAEEELPPVQMSPEAEEELPPVLMSREAEEELPLEQMIREVKEELPPVQMSRPRKKDSAPAVQYTKSAEKQRRSAEEVSRRKRRPVAIILVLCAVLVIVSILFNALIKDLTESTQEVQKAAENMEQGDYSALIDDDEPAASAVNITPAPVDTSNDFTDILPDPTDGPYIPGAETPVEEEEPAVVPEPEPEPEPVEHGYEIFVENVSWEQAKEKCAALGGHLVVINDADEFTAVAELARVAGVDYVWLGGHRVNGAIVWEDGSNQVYEKWGYGEPSYFDGNVPEDYVLLWYNRGWVYNDSRNDPCKDYSFIYNGKIGYVCEVGD